MAKQQLSPELSAKIEQDQRNRSYWDMSFQDADALRRHSNNKPAPVWRPRFAKDIDRIMYSPYYNRYTDKT